MTLWRVDKKSQKSVLQLRHFSIIVETETRDSKLWKYTIEPRIFESAYAFSSRDRAQEASVIELGDILRTTQEELA